MTRRHARRSLRPLVPLMRLAWRAHPRAFAIGLVLLALTLVAGIALLGLSGWFIVSTALAGAAGIGLAFDVFRPSAGIRLLALVRTAGRYGERLITHDATLRVLARLRVSLFHGFADQPFARLAALRGAFALNRMTGDVDALDGLYLRVLAPAGAGLVTLAAAGAVLAWMVDPWMALWVAGCVGLSAAITTVLGVRAAAHPVRRHGHALDAVRLRIIDLVRGSAEFAVSGRLADHAATIASAGARAGRAQAQLDRIDRTISAAVPVVTMLAAAGALVIGERRGLGAPAVAVGVFFALAMNEILLPLRRAIQDVTRGRVAAARVAPLIDERIPTQKRPCPADERAPGAGGTGADGARRDPVIPACDPALAIDGLVVRHAPGRAPILDGLSMTVAPGEWLTLTGPSGSGKSTLLLIAAGLLHAEAGRVTVAPGCRVAYLPQRSQLFAGTIAQNLRLADPAADDERLWWALRAAALDAVVQTRGGLDSRLGDGGTGLSGGESRRLAIARLLLHGGDVFLLDEPTTGLDEATARQLLAALRETLRGRAVVTASHQAAEIAIADRRLALS